MLPRELAIAAFAIVLAVSGARAEPSSYGKVDTFQPGKKYNCVPTADRKGWDCAESGKAEIPASAPEPANTTPATTPAMAAQEPQKSAPPAAPDATPPAPTVHSSALPGYLTNSAASGGVQPMPAAAAPKPAPRPRVQGPMIPAQAPAASAPARQPAAAPAQASASAPAQASASAPAQASAAATTPVPEPPATTASAPAPVANPEPTAAPAPDAASAASLGAQEFLDLPADAYTIELTHADRDAALTAPPAIAAKVYKLHLRQNETDVWLLLCGPYNDLAAARAARDELAAQGLTPGWPRRVGPLQTEVRRAQP